MNTTSTNHIALISLAVGAVAILIPDMADARRVRGGTRSSVHTGHPRSAGSSPQRSGVDRDVSRNVDRDVSRNVDRDIDRGDVDVDRDYGYGRDVDVDRDVGYGRDIDVDVDRGYYRPAARAVGAAAAVTATAAAIGSIVYSLPPSCTTVVDQGMSYEECGGTYYQPQYSGTQVSYVVVNPP